ncbi:hypothetical protein [Nisaea sp.]|uniref:hypothetical protein n=1 Tax=Nisaea sp. TaxID=2024842 RepID=UPI002B264884|nr:hypothetical protein [Nisaea sp.]
MMQDVALGVTTTITQADIPFLRAAGRLGEYAVVYRAYRQQQGGGFGDQEKHPYAWGVLAYVDTELARVYSARGLPREWTDLTRLEKWMREQGFWYWWMRNDLEPLSADTTEEEAEFTEERPAVLPDVRDPASYDGALVASTEAAETISSPASEISVPAGQYAQIRESSD